MAVVATKRNDDGMAQVNLLLICTRKERLYLRNIIMTTFSQQVPLFSFVVDIIKCPNHNMSHVCPTPIQEGQGTGAQVPASISLGVTIRCSNVIKDCPNDFQQQCQLKTSKTGIFVLSLTRI